MNYTNTTKCPSQNEIYYGTQFKRITIFRLIKNVNGQIITDIYYKPADTQQ